MRREAWVLPAAALALTLAACSSSGGGSAADTSAPASSAAPVSSSSGPPSSPSSASSSAAPTATVTDTVSPPAGSSASGSSGPGKCTNSDLTISASQGNGATGHNRYILYFHNSSSSVCVLQGYPGLDALAASGSLLAHARRTPSGFMGGSRHGTPAVPLLAGQYASATVEWETVQSGTGDACYKQSAKIAVTAANTTRAVVLDRSVTACSLQIHPTVPGRTGNLA